ARALFMSDEADDKLLSRLHDHVGISADDASTVQCVGMTQAISLLELYQPTRIKQAPATVSEVVASGRNAVIYAGPGQGKTTLLRYLSLTEVERNYVAPLFFTLRTEDQTALMFDFIAVLDSRRRRNRIPPKCFPILLLVDGYDEVSDSQQKNVAEYL